MMRLVWKFLCWWEYRLRRSWHRWGFHVENKELSWEEHAPGLSFLLKKNALEHRRLRGIHFCGYPTQIQFRLVLWFSEDKSIKLSPSNVGYGVHRHMQVQYMNKGFEMCVSWANGDHVCQNIQRFSELCERNGAVLWNIQVDEKTMRLTSVKNEEALSK